MDFQTVTGDEIHTQINKKQINAQYSHLSILVWMDGIGGLCHRNFLKFTNKSLSASYIPFPRFLMEDSLAGLSNDAKVLYALMMDRASISKVNGFLETDGTIRIYFTVEQAQKKLHRSRQCATRIFHELEFSGLICRKKQGLGKTALITLNYPSNAKLIQPKEGGAISSG